MNRFGAGFLSASVSAVALIVAAPAQAQDASPPAPATAEDAETPLVVVTGSRFARRTVSDSPVPIDVIGGDQLEVSGSTETNKILN